MRKRVFYAGDAMEAPTADMSNQSDQQAEYVEPDSRGADGSPNPGRGKRLVERLRGAFSNCGKTTDQIMLETRGEN